MSISIAHPEKYDIYCWTEAAKPPDTDDPRSWELIATMEPDPSTLSMGRCFWGMLRPEYTP